MKLRDIPWLAFLLAAICGWLGHRIGFDVGRRAERARAAIEDAMRAKRADRSEIAARNIVWRTFNGDDAPDCPERRIAYALMRIIDPRTTPDERWYGLSAFRNKANAYMSDEERARQRRAFEADPSFFIDDAFARLASHDAEAARLVHAIMQDDVRIGSYLRGERIPLETADDGSTP